MASAHPAFAALAALLSSLKEELRSLIELDVRPPRCIHKLLRCSIGLSLRECLWLQSGRPEPHQLACFAPGPASRGYVRHIDEDPPKVMEGGRRLTVTVYFTKEYEPGQGGELRIWPRGGCDFHHCFCDLQSKNVRIAPFSFAIENSGKNDTKR